MNERGFSQKVFIDANFLIAYWIPHHEFHNAAKKKMFELIANNSLLFLDWLIIDEVWYKIWHLLKNEFLGEGKPFKNFFENFKKILDFIEKSSYIQIIQFRNNLIQKCYEALFNVKKYNLRPHDAFHLAIIKDHQISILVTKDSDFLRESNKTRLEKEGIKVIDF